MDPFVADREIRRAFGGRPHRTRPKRWNEWKLIYLLDCGWPGRYNVRVENGVLCQEPNPEYGKSVTLVELETANAGALAAFRSLLESVGAIIPEETDEN